MKYLKVYIWALLMTVSVAVAQTGQLNFGQFWGNPTATSDNARPTNVYVATIAALKALAPPTAAQSVFVQGYYAANDGGGGWYNYNTASTTADNGGAVISPNSAPGTGRWILEPVIANTYTPEQFGAFHNAGVNDDGPALRAVMAFLGSVGNGGNIQLGCNTTYVVSSLSTNSPQNSLIKPLSNVNIIGCGDNSTIKLAAGMNTSSASFVWGIYTSGTTSNVRYANFTFDMNGVNNSCGGTCYASNAAIGIATGSNIIVENVNFINNPGSNDTVFGTVATPPTVSGLTLKGNRHANSCNATGINASCADFSGDFFIATNVTLSDSRYFNAGHTVSSPYEAHGTNVSISNLSILDYDTCGIVANEPGASTSTVNVGNITCSNVATGPVIFSKSGVTETNVNIHDFIINFLSGSSGHGIDACQQMNSASGPNRNISISNVIIYSDVTSNLSNDSAGVCLAYWNNMQVSGVQTYNTQGPGVYVVNHTTGDIIDIKNGQYNNPGHTGTVDLQAGVVIAATAATTSGSISVMNNTIAGTVTYGVIGAENATTGLILGNRANAPSIGQVNWTGTGTQVYTLPGATMTFAGVDVAQTFTANQRFNDTFLLLVGSTSGTLNLRAPATAGSSVIRFPAGSTDFSATGGTSQVVQQSSAGAALTVGQLASTNLSDVTSNGSCTWSDQSGATLTFTGTCKFSKVGNLVHVYGTIAFPSTGSGATTLIGFSGATTVPNQSYAAIPGPLKISTGTSAVVAVPVINSTTFNVWSNSSGSNLTNSALSNLTLSVSLFYPAS